MIEFTPVSATVGGLTIGLAAGFLLLLRGRIAGVSGILGSALAQPLGEGGVAVGVSRRTADWRCRREPRRGESRRRGRGVDPGAGGGGSAGRLRDPAGQRLHQRSRSVRDRARFEAVDRRDARLHGQRCDHGLRGPPRTGSVAVKVLAALLSGILFGAGLAVSQMTNPAKVQGFLDVAGAWDPSLALVMGAALVVSSLTVVIARRRPQFAAGRTAPDSGARRPRSSADRRRGAIRCGLGARRILSRAGSRRARDGGPGGLGVHRIHARRYRAVVSLGSPVVVSTAAIARRRDRGLDAREVGDFPASRVAPRVTRAGYRAPR